METLHWREKKMYAVGDGHIDMIWDMLTLISAGDGDAAYAVMQTIFREGGYRSGFVSQSLQQAALRGPYHYGDAFTSDEWQAMIDEYGECIDYREIAGVIKRYSELAQSKLGGF